MKKPKFKDLKFESHKDLEKWLKSNSKFILELQDKGQDLLKIWVHKTGEILDCNANQNLYLGEFVDLEKLEKGKPIVVSGVKKKGLIAENLIIKK